MYISYVIVPVSYQKHIYLEFNQVFIRNQPQPSLQNFRSGKAEEPLLYTHKHTHTHNINSIDPFQTESKSGSINRADKPPSFLPRQPFPSILLSSPSPSPPSSKNTRLKFLFDPRRQIWSDKRSQRSAVALDDDSTCTLATHNTRASGVGRQAGR